MKIVVIGGTGAMGSIFGGRLAEVGADVTLVDVWHEAVETINADGLRVEDKLGETRTIRVRAAASPDEVGPADLIVVFVKCYHTEIAVHSAAPLIHDDTVVLTLQNGWGNAPRIAEIVGEDRVMAGVTYNSATVLGPGHVQQAGHGQTLIGELDGKMSRRLTHVVEAFSAAGFDVALTTDVLMAIWSKLAMNVCTLPTSALLRVYAGQLIEDEGTLALMGALLRETVAVANAQDIPLDYDKCWDSITGLLKRSAGARASMLQDVEQSRRTEIDVINGAIVEAGRQSDIPTPYNETMVWLIKSLEATFSGRNAA